MPQSLGDTHSDLQGTLGGSDHPQLADGGDGPLSSAILAPRLLNGPRHDEAASLQPANASVLSWAVEDPMSGSSFGVDLFQESLSAREKANESFIRATEQNKQQWKERDELVMQIEKPSVDRSHLRTTVKDSLCPRALLGLCWSGAHSSSWTRPAEHLYFSSVVDAASASGYMEAGLETGRDTPPCSPGVVVVVGGVGGGGVSTQGLRDEVGVGCRTRDWKSQVGVVCRLRLVSAGALSLCIELADQRRHTAAAAAETGEQTPIRLFELETPKRVGDIVCSFFESARLLLLCVSSLHSPFALEPESCVDVKSNVITTSKFKHLIGQTSEQERKVFTNHVKPRETAKGNGGSSLQHWRCFQ
ncbi:unnamed protein product [Pleuronectes platessa]|uniref:Uncharacterized protein n=1 Tax=Pleuronectes platessa TaxID=8262 RepID=A0A9N7YWM9_PLEPL|nr:unnamed protein product [Pleuronectes platessa]